jgi:hypothetical protein
LKSPRQPNIPSWAEYVYSPEYLPVSCWSERRMFPGVDGAVGEGTDVSEGAREWV